MFQFYMSERLQKHLLEKMLRKRVIGSNHIRYENIVSSVPSHEIKNLKKAVESLLKKGVELDDILERNASMDSSTTLPPEVAERALKQFIEEQKED